MNTVDFFEQSPQIMGILNVTPDSFSDGGKFINLDSALRQVELMIEDGAKIIDIGGESTRPGAPEVSENQELDRVIPVLSAIKARFPVKVSVDTSKAAVMTEAILQNVDIINDVCALQNTGCLAAVADSDVDICIMHMQGAPRTMQNSPKYNNVTVDILAFLKQRIEICKQSGISTSRLIVDPGFGFGKTLAHNYQLLAQLSEFKTLNCPILVGISRKSMIGELLNRPVEQRLSGSIAAAIIAAQNGASYIRVHDVKETHDALKVLQMTSSIK